MSERNKELLSPRLLAICHLIDACDTVVDVGSDHGKLGSYCLENQICRKLIATDIHEMPAARTRQHLQDQGYSEQSQVFCTDGLHGVELGMDTTIVIAGMGGLEIRKILADAMQEARIPSGTKMVLQPQRSQYELRSFLCENGLVIEDEQIAKEKEHFYTILKVSPSSQSYELNDAQLFLGPCILKNKPKLYVEYMERERNLMQKKALGDPKCAEILKNWEELL